MRGFSILWCFISTAVLAAEPPAIPVGLDAYRQWERWPYQRIGVRAYMRSTYDRRGGNEGADASHFLCQLAEQTNVVLDVQGPGVLCFARYNHWHGSPWHYRVDGSDYVVSETSTADPNHPNAASVFLPQKAFPSPLTWTWAVTRGADLSWVPIGFEDAFRMAYSRTHYGTGYFIYQQYVPGARLSSPIHSWDDRTSPGRDVLELIAKAGSDLLPAPESRQARNLKLKQRAGKAAAAPGQRGVLSEVGEAPGMLRSLEISAPRDRAVDLGRCRLLITWDEAASASVDAPVALFFGTGTLYNRDAREYLVKAFPVNVRFDETSVHLACYFPMPFFKAARIEWINTTDSALELSWSIRFAPFKDLPESVGYFHATFRDFANPEPGRDLVLLDTRETEGGGDWSGHFVGTSWIFSDRANLNRLEGDPRFFFDDSRTPQGQGTGTEEWGGGGDYWGGLNMTLPFAGHPTGARNLNDAKNTEDQIESAYRFLLADLMPFGRNARICLEHGGQNESTEHYQTVTYWYGRNRPSLVETDELHVGDPVSEQNHSYNSPKASAPYELTSRYEWGVDSLNGREVYPAETDFGRKTTGLSEFNLQLLPDNWGVLLRRKLDYQFPNQRAEVFVAPVVDGKTAGKFRPAGIWYLAGGNRCVYSNPKGELDHSKPVIQESNRRFRDDEFLLPLKLTRGRQAIRVRIKFEPVTIPLMPGMEVRELAWSEFRYTAYCFVFPGIR